MSVRLFLTYAAVNDYEIKQIDIKSAYLYGELEDKENIYIKSLPGNLIKDMKEGQVLKLQKALYGLKQAGRRWYKTLETILKTKGLQPSYSSRISSC